MTLKFKEDSLTQDSLDLSTLWDVKNIDSCNYWFLDHKTTADVTESFTEVHNINEGETFKAEVKVVQLTLESGLGHQTVPLLLTELSFMGCARNWSSLLSVSADMTLEVCMGLSNQSRINAFYLHTYLSIGRSVEYTQISFGPQKIAYVSIYCL